MQGTELYKYMFTRKSIRKYEMDSIDERILEEISTYIKDLQPMVENIRIKMKIVTQEVVKNLLPINAPYYILVSSEKKEGYLTNVGFMLQQMDLYLSAHGMGSCWVGMAKPKKDIIVDSDLEYVIALAFGKPAEPLHRNDISEFKRKSIEEIRDVNKMDEVIEAARLAPSATNSQPWFFQVLDNEIRAFCKKSNFIKALIYEKLNQIDMGISFCQLGIALQYVGKEVEFICEKEAQNDSPNGYYYITTMKIK